MSVLGTEDKIRIIDKEPLFEDLDTKGWQTVVNKIQTVGWSEKAFVKTEKCQC